MAAWVKGGAADADAAIAAAVSLLAAAKAPVIAGLCAELSAVRAAYRLAGRVGASLDSAAADAIYAEIGALSHGGAMTTTPAEAVGRADTFLVVGAAPWGSALVGRIAASTPSRGRAAGSERSILALGAPAEAKAALSVPAADGLPIALQRLRAFAKGHLSGADPCEDLAKRLYAAQFGVVLYDPAELGAFAVEALQSLVKDLNESARVFTLPLADPYQGRAVTQLSAWTTGQAPRVGFGRGFAEHDPWRFDAARQATSGEADAALWLSSLPSPRPDWLGALPAIAIVGEGSPEAQAGTAEIVIAVAVPGRGTGGALWDETRGAIGYVGPSSAPASASPAPEAAGVIEAILSGLTAKEAA